MYGDAAALAWTPSHVSIPQMSYLLPYVLERPGQLWPRLGTCWMCSTGDVCEIFWAFRGKISQQRGLARKNESGQSTRYSWQKTKTIHWSRSTSSIIKTSQCSSTVDHRRWEEEKRQTQEDRAGHAERWPTSDGCRLGRGQVCCWWLQRMEIDGQTLRLALLSQLGGVDL